MTKLKLQDSEDEGNDKPYGHKISQSPKDPKRAKQIFDMCCLFIQKWFALDRVLMDPLFLHLAFSVLLSWGKDSTI